jgi:meckelin
MLTRCFSFLNPTRLIPQLVNILDILWRQTHYDIFFVDWEKSKLTIGPSGNKEAAPVSVWRTLFVANEWEELQVGRLIHTAR